MAERAEEAGIESPPKPVPAVAAVADASVPEEHKSLASLVDRVGKLIEGVAAPAGLVTGFLFFFGWTYSGAFYGYFGINQRLLQYSVRDQLLQSAQPMFGTAVILLTVVAALWVFDRASTRVRERPDRLGGIARAMTLGVGLLAGGVGLLSALGLRPLPGLVSARTAALFMLIGALMLVRLRWQRGANQSTRTEHALLVAATMVAVFWVAVVYANDAGTGLAEYTDRTPGRLPLVTLFTERYIDLPGSSVIATPERSPEGKPLYRYTGLRLLTYSNDRWFLVTGAYDGYRSTVTVMRDAPGLRLEVARQR